MSPRTWGFGNVCERKLVRQQLQHLDPLCGLRFLVLHEKEGFDFLIARKDSQQLRGGLTEGLHIDGDA